MSTSTPILPADIPQGRLHMSEEEYADWAFRQKFESEWVDGEVLIMAPISDDHDDLQWWLRDLLGHFTAKRDLGKVKGPEFQVRLNRPSRREPDVLFIGKSRLHLLKPTYFDGPPDLAMEIVSPSSEARDWREKYLEYEAAGVKEYWIIDPASQQIEAYALAADGKYVAIEEKDGKVNSAAVAGWYVKPAWLWQEPRKNVLEALKELGI